MHIVAALSYGGLERVVIDICKNLDPTRFEPIIVCTKNRGEFAGELEEAGIKVISFDNNSRPAWKYFSFLLLRRVIKEQCPDLVHTHNTDPFLDTTLALLTLGRRPVFLHTDHVRQFPDKRRYMVAEFVASHVVDKIIAVSAELRKNLMKYQHIRGEKIGVISNGIDHHKYLNTQQNPKMKQHGLDRFDHVIGSISVLRQQKGLKYLIAAAPAIIEQFPDVCFALVGDGPERELLEQQVTRLGVEENVLFFGFQQRVETYLRCFDIFAMPSLYEGLPLALLEAMAAGRCVVASAVGGIPDVVEDGENGLLLDADDLKRSLTNSITMLLADRQLRERLAENGYQTFMRRFSVDKMVSIYERLYETYLG